jgi:hypothetical protein
MSTAPAKIAISFSRNSSLFFGHRLDYFLRLFDQVIEPTAGDWITTGVNDDCGFDEVTAERRRTELLSIACANVSACGSSRRMAIRADVSTIIEVSRFRRIAGRHARPIGMVL